MVVPGVAAAVAAVLAVNPVEIHRRAELPRVAPEETVVAARVAETISAGMTFPTGFRFKSGVALTQRTELSRGRIEQKMIQEDRSVRR